MKFISATAMGLAMLSGVVLLALRVVHSVKPDFWAPPLKSAVPLILVGASFACLQFAVPRTRVQMVLGLLAALAFILWGAEQYLSNQTLVAFIDDIVVFLFVLDLSIVIYGQIQGERRDGAQTG